MILNYTRLDRDLTKGLYLDFKLTIEASENDTKIDITDEDGNVIYKTKDYVKTGDILYDSSSVNKNYFKSKETKFSIYKTNKSGSRSLVLTKTEPCYKIVMNGIETKPEFDENDNLILFKSYISWNYDNYCMKDIQTKFLFNAITDTDKDISYNDVNIPNTNNKLIESEPVILIGKELSIQQVTIVNLDPNKIFTSSIDYNGSKSSILLYRMEFSLYSTSDSNIRYFPEEGAFRYRLSNQNEAPVIKIDNIDVQPKGTSFQLKLDSLLRDSNLDDIKYVIYDNQGNTIFQQDYYNYTPRIDRITFNYDTFNFNSLFLNLNAEISDNLTYTSKRSFSYPLFSVTNLRIQRDRALWDIRNYSNNILKTNIEILNMKNEVVYSGDVIANRLEKEYITVTDDKVITLLQGKDAENFYKYYKFRVKIRCDGENYTGYVEFENGTLVSTQHHNAPKIKIWRNQYPDDYVIESLAGQPLDHLTRDMENNKRIKLIFDLDVANGSSIGDYCQYTVSDDSGNIIYTSKDNVVLPQRVELYMPYDFTKRLYNTITVKAVNEYGNGSEASIELASYYIRNARIVGWTPKPGEPDSPNSYKSYTQKIELICDNYYEGDIELIGEVHDLYNAIDHSKPIWDIDGTTIIPPTKLDVEKAPIIKEQSLIIPNTIETTTQYIRFVPKVYYDNFGHPYKWDALKCRIRVEGKSPSDTIRYSQKYFPVDGYLPPILNTNPSISINYTKNDIDPVTNIMTSVANVTFGDADGDWINYSVVDRYGIIDEKDFFEVGLTNAYTTSFTKKYDLSQLNTSMIQWNISCFDEEGLYDNAVNKIPLHYLSNLLYDKKNNIVQYKTKLYTKKPIFAILEILDDEGYLYAKGREIEVNYYDDTKTIEEKIDIRKFVPGNYRYRIKVYSRNENWNLYYPNMSGEVINFTATDINNARTEYKNSIPKLDTATSSYSVSHPTYSKAIENLEFNGSFNTNYETYSLVESYIDENGIRKERLKKAYNGYATEMSKYLYNIDGRPFFFTMKDNTNVYESTKYQPRIFVDGKKVPDHFINAQILNDGLNRIFIGGNTLAKYSDEKDESICSLDVCMRSNNIIQEVGSLEIETKDMIDRLRISGYTFNNIPQYYINHELQAHVMRETNRGEIKVYLLRYVIKKESGLISIQVRDPLYIGDKLVITANLISDRQFFNTKSLSGNGGSKTGSKPIYFIPAVFSVGNNLVKPKKEDLEIYMNGKLLSTSDYEVIEGNEDLFLPPQILFKGMLFEDTDIEMYFPSTTNNSKYATAITKSDIFLKYVYDLDEGEFEFLKEIKNRKETFANMGLDCNQQDIFSKDVKLETMEMPKYFNHNINIFASSSLFSGNNFEDNISIINPSYLLTLRKGEDINCNNNNLPNDVLLNEGIDIEMDYIVNDIEIDCNISR